MVELNKREAILAKLGKKVNSTMQEDPKHRRSIRDRIWERENDTYDKRINAFNPNTLTNLLNQIEQTKRLENVRTETMPNMPQLNQVYIEPHFETMGKVVGMCPHELKELLQKGVEPENQLVASTLKKLISAIKLSTEVDMRDVNKTLQENEESNKHRLSYYKLRVKQVESANAERQKAIDSSESDSRKTWISTLIDLVQKVNLNSSLDSLGNWDRLMCKALASFENSLPLASIVNNHVVIHFEACKALSFNNIKLLPARARSIGESEKETQFYQWLEFAPFEELKEGFWTTDDPNEQEDIRNALGMRQGLSAKVNHLGRLEWVDPDDPESLYEDSKWYDELDKTTRGFYDDFLKTKYKW